MNSMRVAVLAGYSGPRTSMFAGSASDMFSMGASSLGADGADYYAKAKAAVKQFDDLVATTRRIANKQVREDLAKEYIGSPDDRDNGTYRRNGVAGNIATAESFTPVNTYFFSSREVSNRAQRLIDWNKDFQSAVDDAARQWDLLPNPQVIESIKTVEVSSIPGWVPVVVLGAAGVAALFAFGVIGKK